MEALLVELKSVALTNRHRYTQPEHIIGVAILNKEALRHTWPTNFI